jgi:hypothetical protein
VRKIFGHQRRGHSASSAARGSMLCFALHCVHVSRLLTGRYCYFLMFF